MSIWRPAASAPQARKLIVDYEEINGNDFIPEGWYELVESPCCDFLFAPLGAEPECWMPLPGPPQV